MMLFCAALPVMIGTRSAEAAECSPVSGAGEAVRIQAVRPDGSLLLQDGRLVRLAGLDAGSLRGAGLPGPAVMHLMGAADRHGLLPADFETSKSALALVAAGQARVRPRTGDQTCFGPLLAAERGARKAGLGLWGDPGYAIVDASDEAAAARELGRFAVLQGRVSHAGVGGGSSGVGSGRGRLYIDFGPVWRTDVTAILSTRDLPRFQAQGLDPERLEGRMVRVRGVLSERGGPALLITEPAAIELVDDAEARAFSAQASSAQAASAKATPGKAEP